MRTYHAQLAGAKAVVFVDYDPNGKFDAMPRIDEGVVQYGMRPTPADVDIRASIPAVLDRHTSQLQEVAQHIVAFAPPGFPGISFGRKVGFLCVPPQESKLGLSKTKAGALMAEFFAERKKEREEEGNMLKNIKDSGEDQAEKVLRLAAAASSAAASRYGRLNWQRAYACRRRARRRLLCLRPRL